MSLLGRLEDLSLPDIIQIVFLSRRTGILEILEPGTRSTILFHHGLIVSAGSPSTPDLLTYLRRHGVVDDAAAAVLTQTEEAGIPPGVAVLEMNLVSHEVLAELVQQRITATIAPLLTLRDGEFNFILSDALSHAELEYDPRSLFPQGGVAPQKVLGSPEGEKLKPLRGLEESMRAGKDLLRPSTAGSSATIPPAPGLPPPPVAATPRAGKPSGGFDELVLEEDAPFGESLFDGAYEEPLEALVPPDEKLDPLPEELGSPPPSSAPEGLFDDFAVAESLTEPGGSLDRHVILYESSPLLRVAARRAFERARMTIEQFGSFDDALVAVERALSEGRPFVTVIELDQGDGAAGTARVLEKVRQRSTLLPVVVLDREANFKRRARLLEQGADHYITRPSEAHLQPALADEQLAMFADELVRFARARFEEIARNPDAPPEWKVARAEEIKERGSGDLLKHLISELSNPNDLAGLVGILLRLSTQYLDRAVVVVGRDKFFTGIGGAGEDGMDERARGIRISYAEPSVIADVAASGKSHIGKIRKTSGNEALLAALGEAMPTLVAVMPIRNRENVVGVLYGDNALRRENFEDLAGLELFLEQSGFALENAVIASSRRGVQA